MAKLNYYLRLMLQVLCLVALVAAVCDGSTPKVTSGLFATLTTYTNARHYLESFRGDGHSRFDELSLEEKHKQLTEQQCKPLVFYLVGRHSARFPDDEEIRRFENDLGALIGLIQAENSEDSEARQALVKYLEWTLDIDIKQNNLMSPIGASEQQALASRFKRLYPEFFDAQRAHVELGTTSKLRTVQTGVEFVKQVDHFVIGAHNECNPLRLPTSNTSDPAYDVEKVLNSECYKTALTQHSKIELEFHKVCKKMIEHKVKTTVRPKVMASEQIRPPKIKVKEPELALVSQLKRQLLEELAAKIGLNKLSLSSPPPARFIESAFNVCRYETATKADDGGSVWCDLFEASELAALEYLDDANLYHKTANRLESNIMQSCPITKEIVGKLKAGTEDAGGIRPPEAYFGFTHVGVLKKLLSTLGFFGHESDEVLKQSSSEGYSPDDLQHYQLTNEVPKMRRWRASLMVPFSANVGFVLYRCAGHRPVEFKVLTSISERPVRVGGCPDAACPAGEFFAAYGAQLQCDTGRVCDEVLNNLEL